MAEINELKKIKKLYGEEFMHLCRNSFPDILEHPGLLLEIITSTFATNSRTIAKDLEEQDSIEEFEDLIRGKSGIYLKEERIKETAESPYELLKKAGYDLYECSTEKQIQSFKKYYAKGEELCTFHGGRLDRCVVFFAVRGDADKIKREDFQEPKREDEYGTSVMGIQFSKNGVCTVSIKNRYNHTVDNPDATYGNDLDRIVPGLTCSFKKMLLERGLNFEPLNIDTLDLPRYIVGPDGKYYKYNGEKDGVYYCPGNIIIDKGRVIQLENPERQILIDKFILDLEKKTIRPYDEREKDGLLDTLQDIESIEIRKSVKEKDVREIIIQTKSQKSPTILEINKDNQIVGYINNGITEIGDNFMEGEVYLRRFQADNLRKIGNNFLHNNGYHDFDVGIESLNFPNVVEIGHEFLGNNVRLKELKLPNLKKCGYGFCWSNEELTELELPKCNRIGIIKKMGTIYKEYRENNNMNTLLRVTSTALLPITFPMSIVYEGICGVFDSNFCNRNHSLRSLKLPKTFSSVLIRRTILKKNPNCKVELIDIPRERKQKRNIKRPKLHKARVGAKEIAQLDQEQQVTTSEVSMAERIIKRIKNMFKSKEKSIDSREA